MAAAPPLGYIQFGPSIISDFKVFSLDGMQDALKEGSTLVLKGTGSDELVLCTENETYSVAMVETSNTVLLLRPPTAPEAASFCATTGREARELSLMVEGVLGGQHEMKRVVAGVHRVREILREEEWRGGGGGGGGSSGGGSSGGGGSSSSGGGGSGDYSLVGAAASAALAATAAAAASALRAGAGGIEEEADEAGEAAMREMEEEEEQGEQGEQAAAAAAGAAGPRAHTLPLPPLTLPGEGAASAATPAAPPGAQQSASDTQALDLETLERAEERAAALAAAPFRAGKWDACERGLRAPRSARGWTLAELEQLVQASRGEIVGELARLGAAVVEGGRYVLLAQAYRERLLTDICRTVRGEGWPVAAVPLEALCGALEQHHPGAVRAVAVEHSSGVSGEEGATAAGAAGAAAATCCLCPVKVGLRVAGALLHTLRGAAEVKRGRGGVSAGPGGGHCALGVFLDKWHGLVEALWPCWPAPPRSTWPLALCRQLVLVEGDVGSGGGGGGEAAAAAAAMVTFFPEAELPSDPAARFAALFSLRAVWREAELLPFVEPLAQPPHRKLMDLVATYCRVTNNADKSRTFSKK